LIIAGESSAGCVLVNQLSADPANRVLLLQVGPENHDPWIHIPIGYGKNVSNPTVNWCFESEPEGYCDGECYFQPRGRVIGGSIISNVISCNTIEPTIMIAEEAANNILS
jgi:choline dehydrogenase